MANPPIITDEEFEEARSFLLQKYNSKISEHIGYLISLNIGSVLVSFFLNLKLENMTVLSLFLSLFYLFTTFYIVSRLFSWNYFNWELYDLKKDALKHIERPLKLNILMTVFDRMKTKQIILKKDPTSWLGKKFTQKPINKFLYLLLFVIFITIVISFIAWKLGFYLNWY